MENVRPSKSRIQPNSFPPQNINMVYSLRDFFQSFIRDAGFTGKPAPLKKLPLRVQISLVVNKIALVVDRQHQF